MRASFLNVVRLSVLLMCILVGLFIILSLWHMYRPRRSFNKDKKEEHHVIFIKVHKAGSSTVQNIMLRFSLAKNLNVLLPTNPNSHINDVGSEINPSHILPRPPSGHFDVLCDHVVFNEDVIAPYFPEDAARIAIVRDPMQQALSALNYFLHVFQKVDLMSGYSKFPTAPQEGFLEHPEQFYDPSQGVTFSYINNRMSVDLGFNLTNFEASKRESGKIRDFLNNVERQFDLILITEFFDESMVLLRRYLNWSTKNIMYLKINTADGNQEDFHDSKFNQKPFLNSARTLSFHRWAAIDYALYNHFLTIFLNKIKQEDSFQEEVDAFREARDVVSQFCSQILRFSNKGDGFATIAASKWTEAFTVSKSDCNLMSMREGELVALAIARQTQRAVASQKIENSSSPIRLGKSTEGEIVNDS